MGAAMAYGMEGRCMAGREVAWRVKGTAACLAACFLHRNGENISPAYAQYEVCHNVRSTESSRL